MKLEFIPKTDKVKLVEDLQISYRGDDFKVPAGFESDGASLPAWCWTILNIHPFHHTVREASICHDYLYSKGYKGLADKLFKRKLKSDGCPMIQRNLMYWAVRIFGHKYVKKEK